MSDRGSWCATELAENLRLQFSLLSGSLRENVSSLIGSSIVKLIGPTFIGILF